MRIWYKVLHDGNCRYTKSMGGMIKVIHDNSGPGPLLWRVKWTTKECTKENKVTPNLELSCRRLKATSAENSSVTLPRSAIFLFPNSKTPWTSTSQLKNFLPPSDCRQLRPSLILFEIKSTFLLYKVPLSLGGVLLILHHPSDPRCDGTTSWS